MNIEKIIEFLKENELDNNARYKIALNDEGWLDYFKETFCYGNYSYQDTSLEKTYELNNDYTIFTIVDNEHKYAYISLDKYDDYVYDCYLTFDNYEKLVSMVK